MVSHQICDATIQIATQPSIHPMQCVHSYYWLFFAHVNSYYAFDGWLFNIESNIAISYIPKMMAFLRYITHAMHIARPVRVMIRIMPLVDRFQSLLRLCMI
jgi:hypothetical protein